MFDRIIEKLNRIYVQVFTEEKFPDEGKRKSVGGKKIGDVYDIECMPSPEEPGEVIVMFVKDEDKEK